MSATEYRAQFDAVVAFSNGGGLRADGFRVDVPGPGVTEQDVASLFIASLNLLMVDSVELRNLTVFAPDRIPVHRSPDSADRLRELPHPRLRDNTPAMTSAADAPISAGSGLADANS